ncbi:MAG: hypothetical protein VB081_05470 [Christensenella sp.]|uniref:hypothetical protein n=1 Tax=Christensenella sp. TaxID=1935934 RepID=UPI002B1ED72B|nr:hypothetical protein [Christensenella sp.]MEA5002929.1 hypothetical protein [Christensenella sp.]
MKKTISVVLVIAIILTLCIALGGVASAAGVSIKATVSPASLTGAGNVKLSIDVSNTSGVTISNLKLHYPGSGDTVSLDNMASGDTQTYSNSKWAVSDDMIGNELAFELTFNTEDGSEKSVTTQPFTITRKESVVDVSGDASASTNTIKAGDKVKFTFVLQNDGNVKITDCALKAPPIKDGAQIGDTFSLSAGQKRTLEWSTVLNGSADVKPSFTYKVNGETKTLKLDTISITAEGSDKKAAMTVTATGDNTTVKSGDKVKFVIDVKNSGSADLKSLKVVDQNGNNVAMDSKTLTTDGQSAEGVLEATVTKSGSYTFTATATDSDGNEVKATSQAIQINVDAEPSASASVDVNNVMRLDATISTQELSKPGPVEFSFVLHNLSGQELTNVIVSEATLGEIANIPSMTEAEQTVPYTAQIDKTGSFTFKMTATLPDGTTVETSTAAATITVKQTAAGGMFNLLVLMIIIVCAIVGVAIALGVMVHKNKKNGGGKNAKQQRPKQERGYEERPQQRNTNGNGQQRAPQQRQQRQSMPRESIEPRPQPKQRQQRPKGKNGGSGSGYGDRNKF